MWKNRKTKFISNKRISRGTTTIIYFLHCRFIGTAVKKRFWKWQAVRNMIGFCVTWNIFESWFQLLENEKNRTVWVSEAYCLSWKLVNNLLFSFDFCRRNLRLPVLQALWFKQIQSTAWAHIVQTMINVPKTTNCNFKNMRIYEEPKTATLLWSR